MILDLIEKPADVKALSIELAVATWYVYKLLSGCKSLDGELKRTAHCCYEGRMILDFIEKPSDVKALSIDQLVQLCAELRSEIIRLVSKNGGHLGSNLGAIELTVATAYVYKLLSSYKALMETLSARPPVVMSVA